MTVTTIRSLAEEIGVTYWQVRHIIRSGYVPMRQPPQQRKLYLTPREVGAIKDFFGVADAREIGHEEEDRHQTDPRRLDCRTEVQSSPKHA